MKFYYKTLAFASLLALAACSDFDEMNTNPYEPPYSPGTSNTYVQAFSWKPADVFAI